jgi:hypothetical protein
LERLLDGADDVVEARIDLEVPEPQGAESGAAQNFVAHGVVVAVDVLGVLATIDFDSETMPEADEVEVEAEKRRLAAKVKSIAAHIPQLQPKLRLLRRQRPPQLRRTFR